MSFNSHKRKVLDESLPLLHRASHARSCALLVAQKFSLKRESIIDLIKLNTGVDLNSPQSATELLIALTALDELRLSRL